MVQGVWRKLPRPCSNFFYVWLGMSMDDQVTTPAFGVSYLNKHHHNLHYKVYPTKRTKTINNIFPLLCLFCSQVCRLLWACSSMIVIIVS